MKLFIIIMTLRIIIKKPLQIQNVNSLDYGSNLLMLGESHWIRSLHWSKSNNTSDLDNISSPKISRFWIYGSSQLYDFQPQLSNVG